MRSSSQPRAVPRSEEGYVILAAIFFMALLVLSLTIAAPIVAKSIQRDRDVETFHRGMQYRRAVQLYYRKFHAYPPNVDALFNTNQIHFLRKKYTDPITGKNDWKPVMFGQNKTPTAMGFFGQPLAGNASTIAGIGPSGGNGLAGGSSTGGFSNSAFGSNSQGSNSIFSSSDSSSGGTSSAASSGPTDNSGSTSSTGATASAGASGSGGATGSGSSSGTSGQTFGGAGIIGFSPGSPKQSILVYKKKNHYNEWEFVYDPITDMQTMSGGNTGAIGQPVSSTINPVGTNPLGTSASPNPGSSPSSPTTPQ
jgi:type II secretory pathway pseudopilin PulG